MFGIDFYPTPEPVINEMISKAIRVGKLNVDSSYRFLEPSSGSGNIIDIIKRTFQNSTIEAYEIDKNLFNVTAGKVDKVSDSVYNIDFLKTNKHNCNVTLMNPPFSDQYKHIKHAIECSPHEGVVISLFNYDSQQGAKIKRYHESVNLGNVFSSADRKTNINIGMMWFKKDPDPFKDFEKIHYEGFEDSDYLNKDCGLLKYDVVKDTIIRYVSAVKEFDNIIETSKKFEDLIAPINRVHNHDAAKTFNISISFDYSHHGSGYISKNDFMKQLQKNCWIKIIKSLGYEKYINTKSNNFIDKFIEENFDLPFNIKNIYNVLEFVISKYSGIIDGMVKSVFERVTSTSGWTNKDNEKNIVTHETWKTNSEYMINKKIIAWCTVEQLDPWYNKNSDAIVTELHKIMVNLTTKYTRLPDIYNFVKALEKGKLYNEIGGEKYLSDEVLKDLLDCKAFEYGKWFEYGFFKLKFYKKGTVHIEFLDNMDYELFCLKCAKIMGFRLAEDYYEQSFSAAMKKNKKSKYKPDNNLLLLD